ncbi:C-terminal processing protease CtpA/Prc [Rhizomicrobium palustre]|uniref:C-terminal processing protease CtpA/Prc n=1 Tax=Rhizomicrobium palustre TaxID=189966 RepID=A0A846N170_9PROT|nr:S41 family peptidase [Rhizomicrobium palustre]NIK89323.1 C-terminal processing protease CtpA/Prc [Rhizomicrobium palustre]
MTNHGWRGFLAACVLTCFPARADAPPPASTEITTTAALEDLELAISAVEAAIPNIYWHQTRQQWAAAKAAARNKISGVTDSESLWRVVRPLVGQIGEGHLSMQLSDAMQQHYRDAPRFPLDLLWTDAGAFVLASYGEAADIPKGARLISVDGESAADLLRDMVTVTPHDGVIQTGVMRTISGRGFASTLYRLRGAQSHFHVVLDGPQGRIDRDLAAVPRSARPAEGDDPAPLPTLEWLGDHTAYLNVPTFSNSRLPAAGANFPDAIHAVFVQLEQRGVTDLILDLRENEGGSEPNESILFSYLVEKRVHKYAAVEARGRHIAVTSLSGKHFETDVFEDDESQERAIQGGRITRRNTPPYGLMSRWKTFSPIFHGRLVVLAGGNTFSGGAELSSLLYHSRRGVFVGEEVGGTDEGNTSGYRWSIELPNSKMKLTIPLLQFRMAWTSPWRGHGVMPDCPVPPEVLHFGEQRDHAWQVAAALLEQDWRQPHQAMCPKN